jgi:hypothetical protein
MTIDLLTLEDWLELFDIETRIDLGELLRTFEVEFNQSRVSMIDYLKKNGKRNIKPLVEVFNKREDYLVNYYNKSLKVNKIIKLSDLDTKFKMTKTTLKNNSPKLAKNLIRNLFFKGILHDTKTFYNKNLSFLEMLIKFFNHRIINSRLLAPSVLELLSRGTPGGVISGLYPRASIMNPYLVYTLYKFYGKNGSKIFTPTLGWSSYIYGFLEHPTVKEYVGIDVIPDVCERTQEVYSELYSDKKIDIICKPSEDVWADKKLIAPMKNKFDMVFFSPPYYELELYEGGEQSTDRYKTYPEWLEGYWHNTVKLCHYVLKPGHYMVYIISGYGGETKSKTYIPLEEDMAEIAKKYFKLEEELGMENNNVGFTGHRRTGETIFVFRKP